jgi:hypothetical protein
LEIRMGFDVVFFAMGGVIAIVMIGGYLVGSSF